MSVSERGAVAERFAHAPFVCAHLGPDAGGHWERLVAAAPTRVTVRSTGRAHTFAASRAPGLERVPGQRAWTWGRVLVTDRRPATWAEAAHELLLGGFWVGDGEVRMHTDAHGMVELYARELDGTTYLASRVDPLARLGGAPLHTDWGAWGQHLLIGGFIHDATGFTEIRRLDFAESRVLRRGRAIRSRDVPAWMQVDRQDGTADEVLDAVLDQMPAPGSDEPSAIGLSGGSDSRFIAMALRSRGVARPSAWTSHKDTGYVDDVELAAAVAAALGMEHHVRAPSGPGYWRRFREPTLRRFDHEVVLHTWLAPLSARIRRLGVPVWDGLHGDVIFRSVSVNQDILWSGPIAAQREAQWTRLGGRRLPGVTALRLDVVRAFHEDARAAYYRGGEVFRGQSTELVMRTMQAKGSRIIATSPLRLLGPEVPVRLPFAAPAVIEAALRVPAVVKAGTDWYADLLARVDPVVAALPSTNDRKEHLRSDRKPGQTRSALMRETAARIVADRTVVELFNPRARQHLAEGRALGTTGIRMEVMQWAEALVSWRARYRDLLADERL